MHIVSPALQSSKVIKSLEKLYHHHLNPDLQSIPFTDHPKSSTKKKNLLPISDPTEIGSEESKLCQRSVIFGVFLLQSIQSRKNDLLFTSPPPPDPGCSLGYHPQRWDLCLPRRNLWLLGVSEGAREGVREGARRCSRGER
jgi:hypothetical protein